MPFFTFYRVLASLALTFPSVGPPPSIAPTSLRVSLWRMQGPEEVKGAEGPEEVNGAELHETCSCWRPEKLGETATVVRHRCRSMTSLFLDFLIMSNLNIVTRFE